MRQGHEVVRGPLEQDAPRRASPGDGPRDVIARVVEEAHLGHPAHPRNGAGMLALQAVQPVRSEEHTSELQSRSDLVCRLLLGKKKKRRSTADVETTHHLE